MYTLLTRNTFYPDLIQEISRAQRHVLIEAYIWINDETGNKIGKAVLDAAKRGVQVYIRKDLSASVFEHTPRRTPFFVCKKDLKKGWRTLWNRRQGLMTPRMFNLFAFHIYNKKARPKITESTLQKKLIEHKNIHVDNLPLFNHGKLILVDDTAYVGGQCISNDYTEWTDYNVKIQDKKVTENIYTQLHGEDPLHKDLESHFFDNLFTTKDPIHFVQKKFIEEVGPQDELVIEMSYFGKWFVPILKRALKRGVKINIIASKDSDTNHHTNMWVLTKLLKTKSPNLKVFLSDRMIHTKGLSTPKRALMGAANFHNACGYFRALNEQNIFSTHAPLVKAIHQHFQKDLGSAKEVPSISKLPKWNRRSALKEILSVYISSYFVFVNKRRIQKWRDAANLKIAHTKPQKAAQLT